MRDWLVVPVVYYAVCVVDWEVDSKLTTTKETLSPLWRSLLYSPSRHRDGPFIPSLPSELFKVNWASSSASSSCQSSSGIWWSPFSIAVPWHWVQECELRVTDDLFYDHVWISRGFSGLVRRSPGVGELLHGVRWCRLGRTLNTANVPYVVLISDSLFSLPWRIHGHRHMNLFGKATLLSGIRIHHCRMSIWLPELVGCSGVFPGAGRSLATCVRCWLNPIMPVNSFSECFSNSSDQASIS